VIFINYIIDPYQQYRQAKFYTFIVKAERYINPGLIKNYDYDSLLIGTSMVANFKASDIEEKLEFNKVLKVPTFGGCISEQVETIMFAQNYKKIKNILFGLDVYSFSAFNLPTEEKKDFPNFLYDDSILNDKEYLLNTRVLGRSLNSLLNRYDKDKIEYQLDNLYEWQSQYENMFDGGGNVKKNYSDQLNRYKSIGYAYKFTTLKKNFDQYLLPIIKKNKDINFYFFYPPYSILYFKLMQKGNYLDDYLKFKHYVYNSIKKYENIKLYDFQYEKEITHNLANYKDTTHYHQKINFWMLNCMKNNTYLVSKDNIDKMISELKKQVRRY
jgi:hypothetical protein